MNFPFFHRGTQSRQQPGTTSLMTLWPTSAHVIESDYAKGLCRFTLDCSCGVHFDTPYIDEALEWRELHEGLAPLADQFVPQMLNFESVGRPRPAGNGGG